jgi:hypothetical protein
VTLTDQVTVWLAVRVVVADSDALQLAINAAIKLKPAFTDAVPPTLQVLVPAFILPIIKGTVGHPVPLGLFALKVAMTGELVGVPREGVAVPCAFADNGRPIANTMRDSPIVIRLLIIFVFVFIIVVF